MNMDNMTEMAFTRLTWREKMSALPRALVHQALRLLRRERRFYLVLDGKVMAKFVAAPDHMVTLEWLAEAHRRTHDFAFALGKEFRVAQYLADERADAGDPGPS